MPATQARLVPMVLLVATAGCVGNEDSRPTASGEDAQAYVEVVAMEPVQGVYASQPDRSGDEIQRTEQFVRNGTTELWFQANWSGENTGIQLGYALDEADTTWLEATEPGAITKVAIDPDQWETGERRWTFYWRPTSEIGPGASLGSNANVLVKSLADPDGSSS